MDNDSIYIGENVYFYSSKLNEVCFGKVEGYYTDDYKILKILQPVLDGKIRHVVEYTSVSRVKEDVEILASKMKREKLNEEISQQVYSGCVVKLKSSDGLVCDDNGEPYKYQVVAVYSKQARVKLVTDYGEEVGMYNIEDIVVTDEAPLFKMEDYSVGDKVLWVEHDNVFEGTISKLHTSSAEVTHIRKLYPVDHKRTIQYYKIPKNSMSNDITDILTTIKDITIPRDEER